MPIKISLCFFTMTFSGIFMTYSQEVLQWRGNDRTGVFQETNLMKSWPDGGPQLLWEYEGLGNGYSSPVITRTNIYVNGEIDSINYLFALDLFGKFLWKAKIGKEWTLSYPGSRSTPTVLGDLIYVTTGLGTVACLEAKTGKTRWSVDMIKDFHGPINRFGFSESLLADEEKVFFSPGGADSNIVALDRFTGRIKWICKALGEITSYCSPQIIKLPVRNILVTFSKNALLGIDMSDGTLLWSHKQDGNGDVHINTPLYKDGFIYYITGDGSGSVKLKLSEDGTIITEVWKNSSCDNVMGGFIKSGNYIYTASYGKKIWYIQDVSSGRLVDSIEFDKGVTNYADGMLYLYNEKGQLGLFRPAGPKMELVSSFKITRGTKAHFAHPVICNGILYVRHGKSLLAYDIKEK